MLAARDNLWLSAEIIRASVRKLLALSIGGMTGIARGALIAFAIPSQIHTETNYCE
jgi:hypothetical protein